jgi:hypothetical protein
MSNNESNSFDSAVEWFRKTTMETARTIEPGERALFVDLSNDAIEIIGAVLDAYPGDAPLASLVWFDFTAIPHQLFGMGFD